MSQIKGILKTDVTLNGVTYKTGEELSVPSQYGWEDYFESVEEIKVEEEKKDGYIKTHR